jgi:acetyl-CoA acyltransferase
VAPAAFIVDAVRTPFGPHDSKLSGWHAVDLLSAAFVEVVEHSGVHAHQIDHVIAGCAVPIGEQAVNVARNAVLAAAWPDSIPAHTVDAQGASGMLALHQAVALVRSGMSDVCLVGAVSSTRVPDGATSGVAVGKPFGTLVHDRYAHDGGLRSPGIVAEYLARAAGVSRSELDSYTQQSLDRAREVAQKGENKPYLLEIRDSKKIPTVVSKDVLPRARDITKLQPLFEPDGVLTAATFANPASGAVACIVVSERVAEQRAQASVEVVQCASRGSDVLAGDAGASIASTVCGDVLDTALMVDVHEDSAVTPVAFARATGRPLDLINTHGGALARGNALGVCGLASVTALVHRLDADRPAGLVVTAGAGQVSTATLLKVHTP